MRRQKEKQTKKLVGLSEILQRLISGALQTQNAIKINKGIQIYFFFISQLQITFFLFFNDFNWRENGDKSIYIQIILIIFRLDLYLASFDIINNCSAYIIIALMILSKLTIIFLQFEDNQKKIKFYIQKIFGAYIQLYYNFLYIFLSTLVGEFIIFQYEQLIVSDLYYISFIIGIISFILIQIDALFHLSINEQALEVKINFFQKTRVTIKEYAIFFLNLIVLILFCAVKLSEITSWVIHILVLLVHTLKILNQQENYVVIDKQLKFITYFSNSLTLIYIFYSLIQSITQEYYIDIISYTALSFPLLLIILIKIDNVLDFSLFYQALNKQKFSLFATTLLFLKKSNNVQLPQIFKIYIYNQHMKKCNDSSCLCHFTKLRANPTDTAIITVDIERQFIQIKLKQMRSKLFQSDGTNIDDLYYYTVMYGVVLAQNGWIIQGIKHFNQLLFGRSNSKSSNQSINVSIQGANSFSNTIRNDSSSQTLTDPEKKFEDVKTNNQKKQQKHIITFSLSLDMIQREKIFFLLNDIKGQLRNAFGNQRLTEEQHDLSEHIQAFIAQEFKMEQHLKQLRKLLTLKIKYFETLQTQVKEKKVADQLKSVLRISQSLTSFKNKIMKEYENYPSKRLLALQIFFEAEVFTNCSEAYKFHNQSTISEDRISMKNQNFDVNFYSNKISHILVSVDDDLQHVDLLSFSSNLRDILGYNANEEINYYNLFLPFIVREHPLLISRFFKIGKSKYYKTFSQTFMQNRKGYAKAVIFTFDNVVQKQFDKIVLVGLFQEIQILQSYIFVDVNHVVGGLTYSFLQNLGYSQNFIDNIFDFNIFYQLKIKQIFPDFDDFIVNQEQESIIKACNVDTHFMNLEIYFDEFTNEYIGSIKQSTNLLNQLWSTENFLIDYQSNITIYVHELYGYFYYIIQIDSIIQQHNAKKTHNLESYKQGESFEVSQLNLSIEEAIPRTINQFTIKSREGYSQINQKSQQNPNLFPVQEIDQEEILLKIDQLQLMFSPNKSTSQLIEKQQNKLLQQSSQQDYFTNNTSQRKVKMQYQSIEIDNQQNKDQIGKHIDSKLTTEFGTNNEFLKKYELLSLLTKIKTPKVLKIILVLIFLLIILEAIFPLQTILILNTDIQQFISDIEIISLHASIQGPHDLFFSMRNTITAYQQMQREGFLTAALVTNLTEPYYQHVGLGYVELRDSFYKQLDNDYLKYFLDDEYMELRFMKNNDTQIYSLPEKTFRECLLIILQYQFAQMRTFQKRQSTAGQPYQVFLFANYYNIQDKLENITNSILEFSKNRSISVSGKWTIISLIFSLLIALVIVVLVIHYHFYLELYDRFIQILSYADKNIIQVEIEKINQLLRYINSNQQYVYSYRFDLKQQQQKLENYAILDKIQKNKKNLDDSEKIKLPRRYIYLCWIIIIAIFQVFVLITSLKTNDYLSKYDETADFYFMIQQLKFRSGSLFMYKEHFFRFKNFTYLTDYELGRLYAFVDKAIYNIQDYLEFTNTFQPEKYLLSDDFVAFFRNQETMNLCELLDEAYQSWMQLYCDKAFQGQIKKGSIAVLNYMSNSIKQQQAINNFTKRVEVELYELEGGQIVLRAFFKISDEFQSGLRQITLQENYFILVLTIIFTSYLGIFLLIVLLYFQKHYTIEYATLRLVVYLIPQQILLGDESYERYLKRLALTQNLK